MYDSVYDRTVNIKEILVRIEDFDVTHDCTIKPAQMSAHMLWKTLRSNNFKVNTDPHAFSTS